MLQDFNVAHLACCSLDTLCVLPISEGVFCTTDVLWAGVFRSKACCASKYLSTQNKIEVLMQISSKQYNLLILYWSIVPMRDVGSTKWVPGKHANKIMTGEGLFVFSLKTKSVMSFFAIFAAETNSWYYEYIKITTLGTNYTS